MTRHSRRVAGLITGCLAATLLLNGCGGYSSSPTTPAPGPQPSPSPTPAPTPGANAVVVEILGENGNMSFAPDAAGLQVGQQVRWHNADVTAHTATQNGGGFDTGLIPPGGTSAPITVSAPGSLRYHCAVHPSMVGALNVKQ